MDIKNTSSFLGKRALVIGGGGGVGNAWLIGVIAGLFEAGLDVTQADLIIGTSAGSTTAGQITATKPTELLAQILAPANQPRTGPPQPNRGGVSVNHMETTSAIINGAENLEDMRRRMGAWALTQDSMSTTQWRAIVGARLPSHEWPEQQLWITAVNAHTGEPVIFERNSGVNLVDAVAASCAGGFAYQIGDTYYFDGGYRSNADNADLAAGYERVLVLSPFGGRTRTPVEWGTHLATQVEELRAKGSKVETIFPDSTAREAFGNNMMDMSRRAPSAQAGYDQGREIAQQLTEF